MRQAAEQDKWKKTEIPEFLARLLDGRSDLDLDATPDELKARGMRYPQARFSHELTVPFESSYEPGQGGHQHSEILDLINHAIANVGHTERGAGAPKGEIKIGGEIHKVYGNAGKPGNNAGGFTLYTNHPEVYPFRALEEAIDRFRDEIGKNWKMEDGKLVRDFNPIGSDFLTLQHFATRIFHPVFSCPHIQLMKDGKAYSPPPSDVRSDFDTNSPLFPLLEACGIKKIGDLPWKDGMDAFKFLMGAGPTSSVPEEVAEKAVTMLFSIAEQKGLSARITIQDSFDIKRFGNEVGRDFSLER